MPQFKTLPAVDVTDQLQTVTFDFGPLVAANYPPGTYITEINEVLCSVASGTDPDPASRLKGAAQIGTATQPGGSGLENCAVLQQVGTCLGGVVYLLYCFVTLSSGDELPLWGHLPCQVPY